MKNEKMKYSVISLICLALFVLVAICATYFRITPDTDILLISQYVIEGMTIWYVMLIGIIVEMAVIKFFFKESYLKSTAISLIMNLVSVVIGFVGLHIVGLIVELLLIFVPVGSFHVLHWIVNFIFIIAFNAYIEGLVLRIGFKRKVKETFLRLCMANAISFVICFLCNLSWIGEMFF